MSRVSDHILHADKHHRGWSRENPPALTIASGDSVDVRIVDNGGGEITPATTVEDLPNLNFARFTPLTGPIAVDGAEPGDTVRVTFLGNRPSGWGWSMITPRYGILNDEFPDPYLKIWSYDPTGAEPIRYAGGARIPLRPFPGIIGLARDHAGVLPSLTPYPTGGNLDCRDLVEGAVLHLPVEVPGGLLSLGDTHATQGHGELAGTALESPVDMHIRVDLVKGVSLPCPWFETVPAPDLDIGAKGYWATGGVSDSLREAAREATRRMIDLLCARFGVDPVEAYLLCSLCGDLKINEMVNGPVNLVSLYMPKSVFEA
jgi:acetamidase/formamidase